MSASVEMLQNIDLGIDCFINTVEIHRKCVGKTSQLCTGGLLSNVTSFTTKIFVHVLDPLSETRAASIARQQVDQNLTVARTFLVVWRYLFIICCYQVGMYFILFFITLTQERVIIE